MGSTLDFQPGSGFLPTPPPRLLYNPRMRLVRDLHVQVTGVGGVLANGQPGARRKPPRN